jgi:pyruvate dehydrogenase E1 component
MPDYWQFPTVSMGLGPINAIYQAMTNKYLTNRGIKDLSDSHVWAFLGDGEMDEVESRGQLQVAANEGLDNLTFVVNATCSAWTDRARQRQDHPGARGLLPRRRLERHQGRLGPRLGRAAAGRHRRRARAPHEHHPRRRLPDVPRRGRQVHPRPLLRPRRAHGRHGQGLVRRGHLGKLRRGGHDYQKVYAAYKAATEHKGQPTVILAKTIKGYGLGTTSRAATRPTR